MQTRWWLLALVLVVTAVGAVLLWRGPGDRAMDEGEALERLMLLGERFDGALQNNRDRSELVEPVQALVRDWPKLPEGHRLLGQMRVDRGEDALAYASFIESLRLSDAPDAALESLTAAVAERAGRLDEALERNERARALEPMKTAHRVRIANVLLKQGKLDEARAIAERVVHEDGSEHEAVALLALIANAHGDIDAELGHWESAWLASPRDEKGLTHRRDYAKRLARRLIELERAADASRTLLMLDEEAFFDEGVLSALADALSATGLSYEAGRYYEQWWQREPLNQTAAAESARWYLKANEVQESQRMINELRRINAGNPRLLELEAALKAGVAGVE